MTDPLHALHFNQQPQQHTAANDAPWGLPVKAADLGACVRLSTVRADGLQFIRRTNMFALPYHLIGLVHIQPGEARIEFLHHEVTLRGCNLEPLLTPLIQQRVMQLMEAQSPGDPSDRHSLRIESIELRNRRDGGTDHW